MSTLQALAADLAQRTESALRHLLLLRPDAMNPPVPNFPALAARLSTSASLSDALDNLTAPALQLLTSGQWENPTPAQIPLLDELYSRALLLLKTDDAGTRHYIPLTSVPLTQAPAGQVPASPFPILPLFPLSPPGAVLTRPGEATVKNAAGSAIDALLRTLTTLAAFVQLTPLQTLRSGALSARSLRLTAKELQSTETHAQFILDMVAASGLLTLAKSDRTWHWEAPWWAELERHEQWVLVVRPWLTGATSSMDTAPPAQSSKLRTRLLTIVSTVSPDPGAAPTVASVQESFLWHHPRTLASDLATLPELLGQLELLGLTGAGAVSSAGRAAVSDHWEQAAQAVAGLLPASIEHFLIQSDLTAIAPGPLLPRIGAQLDRLTVAEGRGPAGIFRFSESSLRAAVADGMTAAEILDFLRKHSSTTVPQSLEFLIAEAARGTATPLAAATPQTSQPPKPRPSAPPQEVTDIAWPGTGVVLGKEVELQLALLQAVAKEPAGQDEAGPALVLEAVRGAVAQGLEVRVHAVNNVGETEVVTVRPLAFEGGMLHTRLVSTGALRRFSIHRIQRVEVLTQKQGGESGD